MQARFVGRCGVLLLVALAWTARAAHLLLVSHEHCAHHAALVHGPCTHAADARAEIERPGLHDLESAGERHPLFVATESSHGEEREHLCSFSSFDRRVVPPDSPSNRGRPRRIAEPPPSWPAPARFVARIPGYRIAPKNSPPTV